jgi:hypothetical protein
MAYLNKLNAEASDKNVLQLTEGNSGCCPESLTICKYSLVIDAIEDIDTLTYKDKDGNNATVEIGFLAAEDEGDLVTKLDTALRSIGLVADGVLPHINVFFTDVASPAMIIEIFTSAELVNLISTSGTEAFVQECSETVLCCYKVSVTPEDGMALELDDTVLESPGSINGDFGDMATDEAAFTTEVETELDTLYGDDYARLQVIVNNETDKYDVTFWLYSRHKPTLEGTAIALCGCRRDYVAA